MCEVVSTTSGAKLESVNLPLFHIFVFIICRLILLVMFLIAMDGYLKQNHSVTLSIFVAYLVYPSIYSSKHKTLEATHVAHKVSLFGPLLMQV